MTTLLEEDPVTVATKYQWKLCPTHDLSSSSKLIEECKKLNPFQIPGFVVVDAKYS
jgi:hypothetical protein